MDRLVSCGVVRWMMARLLAVLVPMAILGGATAVAQAQSNVFDAVVVEDDAAMRAGGTVNFYIVGKLKKNDRVKVQEMVGGWYSIQPPTSVLSLIAKDQVFVAPGQSVGTVQANDTQVKVLGTGGIGESYRQHATLNKGDTVQLVGEEGGFYKILPPKGALVYVGPGALRRVDLPTPQPPTPGTPAPANVPSTPASSTPVVTKTPTPAVVAAPAPAPAPAVPPVSPAASIPEPVVTPAPAPAPAPTPVVTLRPPTPSQAFAAAEERFVQAMKLPLEQQPIEELLATYTALASEKGLLGSEADLVTLRIAQLKRNAELAAGIKALDTARKIARELPPPPAPKVVPPMSRSARDAKEYDLVGMLLASGVYDGDRLPRLYRLVEPATLRTVAYVRPGKAIDPQAHLGRVVGLMGTGKSDESMKITVFTVRSLDLLEPIALTPGTTPGISPTTPEPKDDRAGDAGKSTTQPITPAVDALPMK